MSCGIHCNVAVELFAGKFINCGPSPLKMVALTVPVTSTVSVELLLPTPTRPIDGWTVSGDLAWRLGEKTMSSAAMIAVMNALQSPCCL